MVISPPSVDFWRLLEILSPFLGLFIPSMIAIWGSFRLYRKRRRHDSAFLRTALVAEIQNMDQLGYLPIEWEKNGFVPPEDNIPKPEIPPPDFVSTTVYESNASKLGMLTHAEVNAVVNFYSIIFYIKSLMRMVLESDETESNRQEELYQLIIRYEQIRPQIIEMLRGERPPSKVDIAFGRMNVENLDLKPEDIFSNAEFTGSISEMENSTYESSSRQ